MLTFDVNWLAILVAVIANMVIGAVWYGVFANPWLKGIGKTREEIQESQSWKPYVVAVLNSVLMAFVLANVLAWIDDYSLVNGLLAGGIVWIGFTGFTFAANYSFEGRSPVMWLINSGPYLVGLLVMGAILGAWV